MTDIRAEFQRNTKSENALKVVGKLHKAGYQAYLVGGLHASYVRRGDVVLIPIRVGAGVRLGVNAGYMRFSKKQRWLPF